ncbi:MAG TPA: efflux RND transporter periplasmic adaptor subunit [Pyrinomonadaceae bacterium]|nr:efflux RND transporter periplasmic adaptor subunit [Pyrinomonadaceae bacterium]
MCCLLAALVSASASCKSGYPAGAQQARAGGEERGAAREVKTARVAEMPVGQTVSVTGTLAALDSATVSVKSGGRLNMISVDLGSVVRKGQPIAQVNQTDYKLRIEQAEAALQQARARLGLAPEGSDERIDPEQTGTVRQARALMDEARANRQRAVTLVEQGVIARAEFESADAAYKVAHSRYQDAVEEIRNRQAVLAQRRSELALARQALADTTVYAPFDGVVQEKRASVGEFLASGAPVATIVRVNPLRFRAEVPEREAASVRAGQSLRVTLDGEPNAYAGRIVRLSPTISEQSRMLVVEAEIHHDGRLRPGGFARADIVTSDTSMAVTVPSNAVVTFAGIEKVIVVENGKAKEKPVTTGRRVAEWTEVLSGVNVGDPVVLDPGNLQSGQAVNVVE